MQGTGWLHERAAVVAQIVPLLRDNLTDVRSDAVDMSKFTEVMCVFLVGATDTTVDCNVKDSDASGGTYTLITGKSASQLGDSDDSTVVIIAVKAEEMNAGARYLKAEMDVGNGTNGADTACVVLGVSRYLPGSDDDLGAVAQIVT